MEEVAINTDTIQLDQFLKWAGAVDSGGQAKQIIAAGKVTVNGTMVIERRKKLHPGDTVAVENMGQWKVSGI